jgi:hypothetical protein
MGWIMTKVSYLLEAYATDGLPRVANYLLLVMGENNGDRLETVHIPMVDATYGHSDNWIYMSWHMSNLDLRCGVLLTEDSLTFSSSGDPLYGVIDNSLLCDVMLGTLLVHDTMINLEMPYIYGLGGKAPVLIKVMAAQGNMSMGLPIWVTCLWPNGEGLEG